MINKTGYVYTPWRVDKGTLHMEFPIKVFLNVSDEDWVEYKNGIIKACMDYAKEKQKDQND